LRSGKLRLLGALGGYLGVAAATAMAASVADPTRPRPTAGGTAAASVSGTEETASEAALTLQGILERGGRERAIINGRTVTAGDRVAGHRVRAIGGRRVVLSGPGGERILRMGGDGLRKQRVEAP
jgi:hypothetical protein